MRARRTVILTVGALAFAVFAARALAAAGDLDPSFSDDGKQTIRFGGGDDVTSDVATQRNGRIIIVGDSDQGASGLDFAIARLKADGTPDSSFSDNGKLTVPFGAGGSNDSAQGVAIDGDGKIVVAGSAGGKFALIRLNADGSLDETFSADGKRAIAFDNSSGATAVAIQPNGKIVLAGYCANCQGGSYTDFAFARLNRNGSIDRTFSGDGKQRFSFGDSTHDGAVDVAIQRDGKIVAVGSSQEGTPIPTSTSMALARLNPDGSLDPRFSGNGKRTVAFANGSDGNGVAIQGDGKVIAAGRRAPGPNAAGNGDFAIARLMPNAHLDTSFSGDGKRTVAFGDRYEDSALDVAIKPDGPIVVGGFSDDGQGAGLDFALARLQVSGKLDTSFSGDGKRRIDLGTAVDAADGVAIQGNGKIVAAGRTADTLGTEFAVVRLLGS